MKLASLLGHALELYPLAVAPEEPADCAVARFFRARKYLGSRDRAAIAEMLWGLIRNRVRALALDRLATAILSPAAAFPEAWRHLLWALHAPAASRPDWPEPDSDESWLEALDAAARRHDRIEVVEGLPGAWAWAETAIPSILGSLDPRQNLTAADADLAFGLPDWMARELQIAVGERWPDEARALFVPASVSLRVNTLRTNREATLEALQSQGIEARPSTLSPDGVLLGRRLNLESHDFYRNGWVEPQDEASQLVAATLAPRPGERILDACAGAGGKSLHLAALMKDEGEVFATDADPRRLEELRRRAARAGATAIRGMNEFQASLLRELDAVLIDAPCSGIGALRRRPDLLFKTAPDAVAAHHAQVQADLLRRWSGAVRVGGVLVYATCTFTRAENDGAVGSFLAERPDFAVESPLDAWRAWHGGALSAFLETGGTQFGRQLTPAQHGCDGFYIARLCRRR
jgi:16S rRNA (cytosine967-C5)-methyltransferase